MGRERLSLSAVSAPNVNDLVKVDQGGGRHDSLSRRAAVIHIRLCLHCVLVPLGAVGGRVTPMTHLASTLRQRILCCFTFSVDAVGTAESYWESLDRLIDANRRPGTSFETCMIGMGVSQVVVVIGGQCRCLVWGLTLNVQLILGRTDLRGRQRDGTLSIK